MNSDSIISLCYVSKMSNKTKELCRIADFHDGVFEPYTYDYTYDFYDTNRDLIIGSRTDLSGDVGSIAVYSWSVEQDANDDWRTTPCDTEIPWIEVIGTFKDTIEQIIEMFKVGTTLVLPNSHKHDLIVCCTAKGGITDCLYFPAGTLVRINDVYMFHEQVMTVEYGTLNIYEDTAQCRCRYLPNVKVRYLIRSESWRPTGIVTVRSNEEIVASAVNTYVRHLDKEGIIFRKERQSFSSVIEKLSIPSISDEVMGRLQCSREDATKHIDQYLSIRAERLSRNEADWIMQKLIENDSEYVKLMSISVESKWQEEHAAILRQAALEQNQAQNELASLQQMVHDAKEELAALVFQKDHCEKVTADALQLEANIKKRISERLAAIQEDRAKALVDEMWIASSGLNFPSSSPASAKNSLVEYDEDSSADIDELPLGERAQEAIDVWVSLCKDEMYGIQIATFFFAAYAIHQNLIIAGECAEQIADIASILIGGRQCIKVQCKEDMDIEKVIREIEAWPHEYICFVDGLERNYNGIRSIMRHFKASHFIITVQHYESLSMEPESLFTTFLPVYADEFCATTYIEEPAKFSCKCSLEQAVAVNPTNMQLRPFKNGQTTWFANGFFAPLLIDRCVRMNYAIRAISNFMPVDGEKNTKQTMLSMVYLPLMKVLRKRDILIEHVAEFNTLEEKQRHQLLVFAGVENE